MGAGDSDDTHSEKSDSDTDSDEEHAQVSTTEELLSLLSNFGYEPDSPRTNTDYFYRAKRQPSLNPPRTFHCTDNIVCHLNRDPKVAKIPINQLVRLYDLPDLPGAIADFISRIDSGSCSNGFIEVIGGRRSVCNSIQTFQLQVWTKIRLQATAYHHPHNILPASTINALPPSTPGGHGQYDSVVINVDKNQKWPRSGLAGNFCSKIVYSLH